MKLKHILLTAVMALFAVSASAANAEDIKIYINPGHGSWGPNNRHMATLGGHETISTADPDTTDFYESNTNLWKCLEMFHRLRDYGFKNDTGKGLDLTQNVVMSRIETGPYPYETVDGVDPDQNNAYNRTLSVIAAEVEAYGADMFISVHSNANTEGSTVNYPIYLYRGYDNLSATTGLTTEIQTTSVAMAKASWPHLYEISHMVWSATSTYTATKPNIRGDINFMGSSSTSSLGYTGYYGVMKHGVPGFLVEGYFHTYQPARHRAMNSDVCRIEGLAYARGIADYFGVANNETTGNIYGIVRDEHEKFSDALYTPRAGTDDVYKPLNGVEVMLKQGENVVATYTTDGNYNGAFVFRNVAPGDYTLEFAHADYKTIDPVAVTVAAATNVYPKAFLESASYEPPAVVYVNYPDSTAGNAAFALASKYNFTGSTNNAIAELEGKTVRRQIIRDGKAYILALDAQNAPFIYLADLAAGTVAELDKAAVALGDNQQIMLSDIALTADHVLVGCSYGKNHYNDANATADGESRGLVQLYKWTKNETTGLPETCEKWFTESNSGNFNRSMAGKTLAYSGTLEEGSIVFTQETTGSSAEIRMTLVSISDGAKAGTSYYKSAYKKSTAGEDYELMVSPIAAGNYVFDGGNINATEWTLTNAATTNGANSLVDVKANGANYFKYAGRSLMVSPDINADGQVQGLKLFDITDGLANAVEIATNCQIEPTAYTYASAHGELALTIDDVTDKTTGAEIELFLNVDGNITKFTTANTDQPVFKGEYAYDLSMEGSNGSYTLKFFVTGDAPEANIILTNTETNVETVVPVGAVTAGENAFAISVDEYGSSDTFNWAVQINSNAIPKAYWVFNSATNRPITSNARGGVAFINDTESDAFGKIVVSNGYCNGIDVYSATQELLSTTAYVGQTSNAASSFRCAEHAGIVYITDWSDAYSGLYTFDPANPAPVAQWYGGTRGASGGIFTNASGTVIGGGTTGLDFYGEGENAQMFVFCEDYPAVNGQTLVRYDFGGALTWDSAPNKTYPTASAKLNLNTNVEIVTTDRGFFAAQVRTAGNNNSGVPAFIFVDYNDNILYNAGSTGIVNGCGGSVAVSPDGSKFAVSTPDEGIVIFALSWGDDNVPAFEKLYALPDSKSTGGNNEVLQLDFDIAGNLHAFLRTQGYRSYSLPNANPTATTAAKKALVLEGTTSGVEGIEAEVDADVPAIYYNLQGVQVENPENGIYIVKRGNKVTKEYIRR